jgi:PAS domain S-box-containing protein
MNKILAIDDLMDNLISIKAVIKAYLPENMIFLAQSGREGIDIAIKEKPDVILLDIIMPGMDGFETCEKLKAVAWTKNIPIIMVSAIKSDVDSRIKALGLGADAFLSKPYDPAELTAMIKVMLRIKAAEDKLRKEKNELDRLVDVKTDQIKYQAVVLKNISDAVVSTDMDRVITSWNEPAGAVYGWNEKEVIGKSIFEVFNPIYTNTSKEEVFEKLNKNDSFKGEVIHHHKDGRPLNISVSVSIIRDYLGFKVGTVAIDRDITAEKSSLKALAESEEKFRTLAETANAGIFIHSGGSFVYVNQNASNETNFSLKEIYKMNFLDLVHPADRAMVEQNWNHRKLGINTPSVYECRIIKKGGGFIWVEISVNLIDFKGNKALIGTAFNITERKHAEELTQQTKDNYETFFNTIDDFLFVINAKGKIVHTNSTVVERLGYTEKELYGNSILMLNPEEYRDEAIEALDQMLNVTNDNCNIPIITKSGTIIPVETKVTYGIWAGQAVAFVVSKDITKIKLSEEKFSKLFYINPSASGLSEVKSGRYIEVNDVFCELFGFEKAEVIGKTPVDLELLTLETINELSKHADENGRFVNVETSLKAKNGEIIHVLLSAEDFVLQGVDYRFTVAYDITARKKAEKALQESEKRLQDIILSSADRIWEINEKGKYTYISEKGSEMFGFSREEIIGKTPFDFVEPSEVQKGIKLFAELATNKLPIKDIESWNNKKDNNKICILTNGVPILDEFGNLKGYRGVDKDITDRKEAEKALMESEASLENSQEIAKMGSWSYNFLSNETKWSKNQYRILGFNPNETISSMDAFISRVHTNDLHLVSESNDTIKETMKPVNFEFRFVMPDGSIKWIFNNIVPVFEGNELVGINGVNTDITSRKEIENSLYKSEEKYRTLVETLPVGICRVAPDGSLISANNSFIKLFECDSEASFEKTNLFSLTYDVRENDSIVQVVKQKGYLINQELKLYTLTKKVIWVSISLVAHKDENGNVAYIDCVFSNIHERKIAEELLGVKTQELQQHKDNLEELVTSRTKELERSMILAQSATKAKSEFLANMSHEVRTPMNAIIGFSDILYTTLTDKKQLSQINSIRSSASNLMRIINDILDLSKVEAGKIKLEYAPINIKRIIDEIKSIFNLQIVEKELDFEIIYAENMPSALMLDEVRLRQILVNLIGNAVKFTEEGKVVLYVDFDKNTKNKSKLDLIIKVEDTGIGIPIEQQEEIFEAFNQVKGQNLKKYGGTGLGLTITKRLIEVMNGSIKVNSSELSGSVFEVCLPEIDIVNEKNVLISDKSFNPNSIIFNKAKILICDDIPSNRDVIIDLLSNSEIEFIEANTGEDAIKLANEHKPDLILMDIKMPEMDGFEATKIIKSEKAISHIPVIAITALVSIADHEENINNLFEATLVKPVDISLLIRTLRLFLKYKKMIINNKEKTVDTEDIIITDDIKMHLPEIVSTLEDHFLPLVAIVEEKQNIDKAEKFAKEITEFGKKVSLDIIIDYGKKVSQYAENIEIEKLSVEIKKLRQIIEKLKKLREVINESS